VSANSETVGGEGEVWRRWTEPRRLLRFGADWLSLRERLDFAARNRDLAVVLAERLPKRPLLIDLGAGTGSLFRFLAPIIAGTQRWIFADIDRSLIETAIDRTAWWAKGCGFSARLAGMSPAPALTISTSNCAWYIETLAIDLTNVPRGLPLDEVDAVVCSALLDLTSRHWIERLVAELRTPFYSSLTVDGRDAWSPPHPADLAVRLAFQRDQRREKGLGLALGVDAVRVAEEFLATSGFETLTARSDWLIGRGERFGPLFARMTARAARRAVPAEAVKFAEWTRARRIQAADKRLAIRIGHRDILAFPRMITEVDPLRCRSQPADAFGPQF
jgi:hypothetical protein